ncbi:TIGR01841 family phasin [Noviherbaspirillum massiliense]|uniref:TIGR01841 family phasin n=1 Tax=Noviherbaspirillum massiliense TaxID=1465823 RepID=UPI0003015C14|nr:TIGR01841 family phasin [Noviherbaspirillum massiliense]
MFALPEQLSSATKTNLEAQLSFFTTLTSKAFESVEKVVDLNITAAKASLEDSAAVTRQLLAAKDAQEFFTLTAAQAQPNTAKVIAYGRHLFSIASNVQAELARATEEQVAETSRKVNALVDDVSKNAPAGSENVIAIVKSALGNANAGYEQFSKTTKQAAEVMEANLTSAVNQFAQAAEKTASAGRARK